MTTPPSAPTRRLFLRRSARVAAAGVALPWSSRAPAAMPDAPRSLAFAHTHTKERIALVYAAGGQYLPGALVSLNHFLRDHYTGEVGVIDPALFDLLHRLRLVLGTDAPLQVISGYRCPATNARLRRTRNGGVASRSLHLEGRAIDVRIAGVPLAALRDAALSLGRGGVGFYPREHFVHVDTGRVRAW